MPASGRRHHTAVHHSWRFFLKKKKDSRCCNLNRVRLFFKIHCFYAFFCTTSKLTVFLAEWSVAAFEVLEREDFEENGRTGQEQQQHRLEAVRGQQHISVMQGLRQHTWRPPRGVHQNLHVGYIFYTQKGQSASPI